MPSRGSRRLLLERVCRVGALAALAALMLLPWTPRANERREASSSAQLASDRRNVAASGGGERWRE
jgi:hypothetical protein